MKLLMMTVLEMNDLPAWASAGRSFVQCQSKSDKVVGDADSDVWVKLRSWCRCHSVAHLDAYAPSPGL